MDRRFARTRAPKLSFVRRGAARVARRHVDAVGGADVARVSPHGLGVLAWDRDPLPAGARLPPRDGGRSGRRPSSATHGPRLDAVVGDGARVGACRADVEWPRSDRARSRARHVAGHHQRRRRSDPTVFRGRNGRPREPRERRRFQLDAGDGWGVAGAGDRRGRDRGAGRRVVLPRQRCELRCRHRMPARDARSPRSRPPSRASISRSRECWQAFGSRRPRNVCACC